MNTKAIIENQHHKKSQIEHIFLRPSQYIGSVETEKKKLWILNQEGTSLEEKEIDLVPAFYKLFDDIIVNAAQNFYRNQKECAMTELKVVIDQQSQLISVWNNGKGIPVVIHQIHKVYVPEMIFGTSHFNSGGFGVKLINIFSKKFIIECNDEDRQKYCKQEWRKNSQERTEPYIGDFKKGRGAFTCVTFYPDLSRLSMSEISDDVYNLLKKRVYDMAAIFNSKVNVFLNGEQVKVKSFLSYVDMFIPDIQDEYKVYDSEMTSDRWEILVTFSDGQFKQVSYVNNICTNQGGNHVDYVAHKIVDNISDYIQKYHRDLKIKKYKIKNNLFIFVNSFIENPTFDSSTKETLSSSPLNFGSLPIITKKFISNILKPQIVEQIVLQIRTSQNAQLANDLKFTKMKRILGIPGLEDANDAGTINSHKCTLILTQGYSNKALIITGIEVVGKDRYGALAIDKQFPNVRAAPQKLIMENEEIQNICRAVGLDFDANYQNTKKLRYGSIMIVANQDNDGTHFKGLIINFIAHFWPSLLKMNRFLKELVIPTIKVTKDNEDLQFFNIQDFKTFADTKGEDLRGYKVKYLKDFDSLTDLEIQEYFSDIYNYEIMFIFENDEDLLQIELAFSISKFEARKQWLSQYNPNSHVDYQKKQLRYKDFIDNQFIHCLNQSNIRSIPSICDGFKLGQRKILFSCFKKNLQEEIKVSELIGFTVEHSAKHYEEVQLLLSIIGMGQTFVGANNINLLVPIGQFGTRSQGGRDHATARYIFTHLSKVARILFNEHDDHVLKYLEDDNKIIEPEWYLPIIPMCLVNGSFGIGTGWSTNIPNYNHRQIVHLIKKRLEGTPFEEIHPWYKGFQGTIEKNSLGQYNVKGKCEVDYEQEVISITELPIRKWTRDYKNFLEEFISDIKGDPEVEEIREYHKNQRVKFEIQVAKGKLVESWGDIEKKLKLSVPLQKIDFVMFNPDHQIKRYNSSAQILEEFFEIRLRFYQKRKNYLISKLQRDIDILSNQIQFMSLVSQGMIEIKSATKKDILQRLFELGLVPMSKIPQINSSKIKALQLKKKENPAQEINQNYENQSEEDKEDSLQVQGGISAQEYNYLLSIPIFSFTLEDVDSCKKKFKEKEEELCSLKKKDIKEMWNEDLDLFLVVIHELEVLEEKNRIFVNETEVTQAEINKENQLRKNDKEQINVKESTYKNMKDEEYLVLDRVKRIKSEIEEKKQRKQAEDFQGYEKIIMSSCQSELEINNLKHQQSLKPTKQSDMASNLSLARQALKKQEFEEGEEEILMGGKKRKREDIQIQNHSKWKEHLKKRKVNKREEDDSDFDLDLDYLEPSQDIIEKMQTQADQN